MYRRKNILTNFILAGEKNSCFLGNILSKGAVKSAALILLSIMGVAPTEAGSMGQCRAQTLPSEGGKIKFTLPAFHSVLLISA